MTKEMVGRIRWALERLRIEDGALDSEMEILQARKEELAGLIARLETAMEALSQVPDQILVNEDEEDFKDGLTNFERIVKFMSASPTPNTIAEIQEGTEIARASISAVLYRTHPQQFTSYDTPGRAKAWALRKPAVEDLPPPPAGRADEDIPF